MKTLASSPKSRFRYLPVLAEQRKWGLFLTDCGYTVIEPGTPYPPRGHPDAYADARSGRDHPARALPRVVRRLSRTGERARQAGVCRVDPAVQGGRGPAGCAPAQAAFPR